jgi:hypothetical protein
MRLNLIFILLADDSNHLKYPPLTEFLSLMPLDINNISNRTLHLSLSPLHHSHPSNATISDKSLQSPHVLYFLHHALKLTSKRNRPVQPDSRASLRIPDLIHATPLHMTIREREDIPQPLPCFQTNSITNR